MKPPDSYRPNRRAQGLTLAFDAWNVAQTGRVAAHMPIEERIRYAALYGIMRSFDIFRQQDRDAWDDLQGFDGATRLDHADLIKLRGVIARLHGQNETFNRNWPGIVQRAKEAGVKIQVHPLDTSAETAQFCGSLFAKPPGH